MNVYFRGAEFIFAHTRIRPFIILLFHISARTVGCILHSLPTIVTWWSRIISKTLIVAQLSRNYHPIMEFETSLRCLQKRVTGLCSRLD